MNINKKRVFIVLVIIVLGIVSLNFYLMIRNPLDFSVENLIKIEIRNGNTGKLIVLENEKAKKLSDKLASLDTKLTSIHVWSCGYSYTLEIITSNNSKRIIVYSNNYFVSGIFSYKTEEDIIKLIEDIITK